MWGPALKNFNAKATDKVFLFNLRMTTFNNRRTVECTKSTIIVNDNIPDRQYELPEGMQPIAVVEPTDVPNLPTIENYGLDKITILINR